MPHNLYYRWSKNFLEAGKKCLMGDTTREGNSHEASDFLNGTDFTIIDMCSTFYNWYRLYLEDGVDGLGAKNPKSRTFWNKIPVEVKEQVLFEALEQTELSPTEMAYLITDTKEYFISESSVYRILKAHDLITSPAYILMQAGDSFKKPTRRIHELWQRDSG
jgi:hypothetical protein